MPFLQGMQFNQIKTEAESMLSDLQFEDKRNSLASKLSGGMKRKLRYTQIHTYTHNSRNSISC